MSEEPGKPKRLDRRSFLKGALVGTLGGVLGAKGFDFLAGPVQQNSQAEAPLTPSVLPTRTETKIPIQTPTLTVTQEVTATPLPQEPPPREVLNATATAIAQKGENTSFVEDKEFSKEFFEKVRKETFMVEFNGQKDGNQVGTYGSGFAVKNDEGKFVLVTNKHLYWDFDKVTSLRVWRPGIDAQKIAPPAFTIIGFKNTDQGITTFDMPQNLDTPVEGLKYEDKLALRKGTDILVAGFPSEFYDVKDQVNKTPIYGSHLQIEEDANPQTGEWNARGVVNGGSSGSVAVVNDNGEPVAIGVVHASKERYWKEGDKTVGSANLVTGLPLFIHDALGK